MGTEGLNFQRLLLWVINKLFIFYFPTLSLSPGKFNEAVQKMISLVWRMIDYVLFYLFLFFSNCFNCNYLRKEDDDHSRKIQDEELVRFGFLVFLPLYENYQQFLKLIYSQYLTPWKIEACINNFLLRHSVVYFVQQPHRRLSLI